MSFEKHRGVHFWGKEVNETSDPVFLLKVIGWLLDKHQVNTQIIADQQKALRSNRVQG